MNVQQHGSSRHVAVLGGGLAGLAAAVAFCERGWRVSLFEARRQLGGRAGSFVDSTTAEITDHCQHVSLGCCVNFQDFCRRTGMAKFFYRDRALTFIGSDGRQSTVRGVRFLPAPLHLLPGLCRLKHLPLLERFTIAQTLWRMARIRPTDISRDCSMEKWLRQQGATQQASEEFWSVILVSALAERLDRISFVDARKVFVEGFMANSAGYELQVPAVPLGSMYQDYLVRWLEDRAATCHLATPVKEIIINGSSVQAIELSDGSQHRFDGYVLALPWKRVKEVIPAESGQLGAQLTGIDQIESSSITGVHLWFDRPITELRHAVIVGRLSQWLFSRGSRKDLGPQNPAGHYYQVVISASQNLNEYCRDDVIEQVQEDLRSILPQARHADLIHARLVTQRDAVFVVPPNLASCRPDQQTALDNLALAGDWTNTGWPATMEGAVRSGYLAAEVLLQAGGDCTSTFISEQKSGWLAQWFLKENPNRIQEFTVN